MLPHFSHFRSILSSIFSNYMPACFILLCEIAMIFFVFQNILCILLFQRTYFRSVIFVKIIRIIDTIIPALLVKIILQLRIFKSSAMSGIDFVSCQFEFPFTQRIKVSVCKISGITIWQNIVFCHFLDRRILPQCNACQSASSQH